MCYRQMAVACFRGADGAGIYVRPRQGEDRDAAIERIAEELGVIKCAVNGTFSRIKPMGDLERRSTSYKLRICSTCFVETDPILVWSEDPEYEAYSSTTAGDVE